MIDESLVKEEIVSISSFDGEQVEKYKNIILSAVSCVESLLKDKKSGRDVRIIHLCAVKAYYQIVLMEQNNDGVTSFSAGDVSYSVDTSSADRARALLDIALSECRELMVSSSSFAFKAV